MRYAKSSGVMSIFGLDSSFSCNNNSTSKARPASKSSRCSSVVITKSASESSKISLTLSAG